MVGQMKIGAVILVAGVGIPDEEMEKFLEMKRPTIFEQMIVSYQRAGVADIALVTRDGMADKIEQTLHRRGVTFLDIESDSFELAVLKGLSYLSDTCERIFVGDIRFPFFQPDILVMMQKRRAELLGAVYGGMFGDLICTSQACARNICKKLEQQIEESAEMAEEANYNMIDGLMNNTPKKKDKNAPRRSVLKRLRNHQKKIASQGKGQPQQQKAMEEEMERKKK